MRDRLTRLRGAVGLGATLVVQRFRRTAPRRVIFTVLGVALAVGLFVTVAGVGVGLAGQGSAVGSNADYWIVPESESSATLPVSVGGPQLGSVHAVADRLSARDDVRYASPVAVTLTELTHGETTEHVLVMGVVAHPDLTVGGVSAGRLTPGDPHYANGTYDAPRTAELVASAGTGELLGVRDGDTVTTKTRLGSGGETHRLTVVNVSTAEGAGFNGMPVALVHLSELQSMTGGTERDTADQLLVATASPGAREDLERVYDHTDVVSRTDTAGVGPDADLALALGGAGLVVSLVIGVLFVATTMGIEIRHDRRLWATLTALGFSARSRALVLLVQSGIVALAGGTLGVLFGRLGIAAANAGVGAYLDETTVAVFPAELAVAGLALALGIAAITAPYLVWLTGRGTVTEALSA